MPVAMLWYASAASSLVLYPGCTSCAYGRMLSIAFLSFDNFHLIIHICKLVNFLTSGPG